MYLLLYYTHVVCVIVSISGFVLRALLKMRDHPVMRLKAVRILPHLVDTLLLASAIGLMLLTRQYPFVQAWLTAKVVALVAYILFGIVCLRTENSRLRLLGFLLATATFAYMVAVALTRSALGLAVAAF